MRALVSSLQSLTPVSPVLASLPLQRDFAPSRPSGLALQLKGLFQATLQRLKISNVTGENEQHGGGPANNNKS